MSIASFFSNLFHSVESEAPVLAGAYDQIDNMAGFFLGVGEAIIEAGDPALTPIVTPLVAGLNAVRAAAKSAVDGLATDAVADSSAAATAIANLTSSVAALAVAAGPGVKVFANVALPAA
jgi:hypothetical protein